MTLLGKKLDSYEILREIGYGGMATVYLAEDHGSTERRRVALKILHLAMANRPDILRRFRREAELYQRLQHPRIVRILDFVRVDGQTALVMPYLAGGSLADRIKKEGRITWSEAVRITGQIAEALDYAHQQGVVHRDVKPSNILFDDDGEAFLTDFGIAHDADASTLTAVGTQPGTYHYMAPEQVRGDEVDGKADQFALATVFYQMVSGRLPFSATDTAALTYQIVHEATAKLPSNIDIPYGVSSVLERAHHKDPKRRYSTVGGLAAALQELSFTATPIRRRRLASRLTRAQRRRIMAGIAALFAIMFAVKLIPSAIEAIRTGGPSQATSVPETVAVAATSIPTAIVILDPTPTEQVGAPQGRGGLEVDRGVSPYPKSPPSPAPTSVPKNPTLTLADMPTLVPTRKAPAPAKTRTPSASSSEPTSTPVVYRNLAVTLLYPADGFSTNNFVEFSWLPRFSLLENEAFELVIWRQGEAPDRGRSPIAATTSTGAAVNLQAVGWMREGPFYWGVYLFDTATKARIAYLGGGQRFVYQPLSDAPAPPPIPGINE